MLHGAAGYGLVDYVQQLIKAGSKKLLFATDKNGRSALHYASFDNCVEAARLLIKEGGTKLLLMIDVNCSSELHFAALEGHVVTGYDSYF